MFAFAPLYTFLFIQYFRTYEVPNNKHAILPKIFNFLRALEYGAYPLIVGVHVLLRP